jgi:hypothetical protein
LNLILPRLNPMNFACSVVGLNRFAVDEKPHPSLLVIFPLLVSHRSFL